MEVPAGSCLKLMARPQPRSFESEDQGRKHTPTPTPVMCAAARDGDQKDQIWLFPLLLSLS